MVRTKKRYRRGYPVAILAGIEEKTAVIWKVFSNVAKPEKTLYINGTRNNPKDLYKFHESIINAIRPTIKEGVRSIILASPTGTSHNQELINHIREHDKWLIQGPNKVAFSKIAEFATTSSQVAAFTKKAAFHQIIKETTEEETKNIIEIMEKRINSAGNNSLVLFSLEEVEKLILKRWKLNEPKPEWLMLTNKYLEDNSKKNRLHRLMQIATNKKIKTRIINAESPSGKRLTQLGGLICLVQHR
jgi:stalled ribosome rescue protein Dom34